MDYNFRETDMDFDDELSEDYSVTSFEWSDDEAIESKKDDTNVENVEDTKTSFRAEPAVARSREELFRVVSCLYKSPQYSDIVIHCNGGKLPCHMVILGSASLVMRDLLTADNILDIYLLDFDVAIVATALQLIYTGTILVNNTDMEQVKLILHLLGVNRFEIMELKDKKKKETKNKLKVKHEKNLGSRKPPVESKIVMSRKKRVFMANLDPAELTCDICRKTFPALYKLKIHKLIHSDTYPFMCMNCGKGFNNKYKMHSHEKKKLCEVSNAKAVKIPKPPKTVNVNIYNCSECPTSFSLVKDLKRHIQVTHRVKQELRCVHCSTICRSQKNLIAHLKVVHNDHESGLKCTCGICGKKFQKLSNLEDHIQRHSDMKQFGCMYCPKRCATKQDLDRHLRSHSGEATFTCQFCSRNFVHRKTYSTHVRKHLGQKPYMCIPCKKSFTALNYLKKHQSSHLRKGDQTRIVTAKKGGRGSMAVSYIELVSTQETLVDTSILDTNTTSSVYIPGPHYIQTGDSTVTPLVQVITDYTESAEVSRLTYDTKVTDNLYSGADCPVVLHHEDQDQDSNDGYLLELFEDQPSSTQTTLQRL